MMAEENLVADDESQDTIQASASVPSEQPEWA